MRKRVVLIGLIFIALAAITLLFATRSPEPAWQGKRLSAWMEQLSPSARPGAVIQTASGMFVYISTAVPPEFWTAEQAKRQQACEAIRAMGTNALPFLLSDVYSHDSKLRSTLIQWTRKQRLVRFSLLTATEKQRRALAALSELGPAALWAWVDVLTNDVSTAEARSRSIQGLYSLMPRAAAAVPAALTLVDHPDPMTRRAVRELVQRFDISGFLLNRHDLRRSPDASSRAGAAWSLGFKCEHPDWSIALLTTAAKDPEARVRESAVEAIGKFSTNAASALPVIHRAVEDPHPRVRRAATNALAQIARP